MTEGVAVDVLMEGDFMLANGTVNRLLVVKSPDVDDVFAVGIVTYDEGSLPTNGSPTAEAWVSMTGQYWVTFALNLMTAIETHG